MSPCLPRCFCCIAAGLPLDGACCAFRVAGLGRRVAVEGAVGIAEVGLRRESGPGGDFLDAETLFHYEALRLVHPDGEGVFPKACPEDFPESRAKGCGGHASRLR